MRLKEDSTSYRASGLRRRDARQQRPDDQHRPAPRKKKNTKRWCRGHVGREHEPVRMVRQILPHVFSSSYYVFACRKCGKELDHYFPRLWGPARTPPDWMKP